jgi:hypothetical protein
MSIKNKAEKLYVKYYKKIRPLIGINITYSNQLNKIGVQLFGRKFLGVYSSDDSPMLKNNQSMIINVDKKNQKGSHWLAVIKHNNIIYVYDSFGRHTKNLIPHFFKKYKKVIDTEYDAEQKDHENDCGLRSLTSLAVYYNHGIKYFKML